MVPQTSGKIRANFTDETACRIFLDSVRRAQEKYRFHVWSYVVMPTHVHLLIWPSEKEYDVARILHAINGAMSRRYSRLLARIDPGKRAGFIETHDGRNMFQFWQRGGGFDRNLYNDTAIHDSMRYIENHPVRSSLVVQADEYRWSSAWNGDNAEKWRPIVDRSSVPVKMVSGY